MDKKTDELLQILSASKNAGDYFKENGDELLSVSLTELLENYLHEKHLEKADVIRDSNLDRVYAYQIFSGLHKPGRDKLLCLAFGLHLNVPETQLLLKTAQLAPLYPRITRDVFILEAIFQEQSLMLCNENLETHGQPLLQ